MVLGASRRVLRGAALGLALGTGGACLVVDRVDYGEASVPPHLTRIWPRSFTRVPPEPDVDCKADQGDVMRFTVAITDFNIEDPLEVRLIVNGQQGDTQPIAPTGEADRGELTLCASSEQLSDRCNYVVLAATRRFAQSGGSTLPQEPGDIATVEWWVLGRSSTAADAEPEDCALKLNSDGGVP